MIQINVLASDETVYFIHENKVKFGKIEDIEVQWIKNKGCKAETHIVYGVAYQENHMRHFIRRMAADCFETKQKLLKSL